MVWAIGGAKAPVNMEVTYNTPGTTDIYKTLSEAMRQPSTIMVNIQGQRIINEQIMNNTTYTGNAILQQTGNMAFTILGQYGVDYMKEHGLDYITYHHGIKDMDKWEYEKQAYLSGTGVEASGLSMLHANLENVEEAQVNFWECDSLEQVCEVTGIDLKQLKKTIERYNSFAGGYDEDFVKPSRWLRPITGDKYYVARHFPSGYGSLGGIKVNHNMQVLDVNDKPIPGLYGCGTDTATVFSDSYCFYNPGSTMSYAINSGRIAGMESVDYIESEDFVE